MLIQACSLSTSCMMADPLTRLRSGQLSAAFFMDLEYFFYLHEFTSQVPHNSLNHAWISFKNCDKASKIR